MYGGLGAEPERDLNRAPPFRREPWAWYDVAMHLRASFRIAPIASALLVAALVGCGDEVSSESFGTSSTTTSTTGTGTSTSTSGGGGGTGGAGVGGAAVGGSGGGSTSTGTSTTTGAGGAGGGGGMGAGGGPSCPGLGDACTDCTAAQCPATYCACYGNLECSALLQCLQGCAPNDPMCGQTCLTAHEDGISAAFLLGDCAATTCSASCPNATNALTPCQQCLYGSCDIQMNACIANPECTALVSCYQACGANMACQQQCATQHPQGLADAGAVSNCAQASCSNTCN